MRKLFPRRSWRAYAIAPAAAIAALALVLTGVSPAVAAPPKMTATIAPASSSVPSGGVATYRVTYSCSNITPDQCVTPTFTIPRPVGTDPNGDAVPMVGTPTFTGNADVASSTGTDPFVVTLNDLKPGTTGEFSVGWQIPTNTTLPGTTFPADLELSFTPGAEGTQITIPATTPAPPVQSTASPAIQAAKQMVTPTSAADVKVDQDVTYRLFAYNPKYNQQGSLNYRNLQLVDRLPAGTVFVSATGGGVYDPTAETVTWSVPNPTPGGAAQVPADQQFQLTVRYPAAVFKPAPANPPATNTFTNFLDATATALDGTALTSTAQQQHSVIGDPLTPGSGTTVYYQQKRFDGPTIAQSNTTTTYQWSTLAGWYDNNVGGVTDLNRLKTWSIIDRLPCLVGGTATSPGTITDTQLTGAAYPGTLALPADQCTNPAFDLTRVQITSQLRGIGAQEAQFVTWDGTQAHTYNVDLSTFSGWIYKNKSVPGYNQSVDYSLDLPTGEIVTDFRVVGNAVPEGGGAGQFLRYNGTSTAAFAASGLTAMQNNLSVNYSSGEYAPGNPLPTGNVATYLPGALANFTPSTIDPQVTKAAANNVNALKVGDTAKWRVTLSNGPAADTPINPKLVDIIPAGLEFQPDSTVWSNLGSLPVPAQAVDTITIGGVEHTRVTWTWPAGTELQSTSAGGPSPTVNFDTIVTLGAPDGPQTGANAQHAVLFDQNGNWTSPTPGKPTDADDVDGDGNTSENVAESTVSWTVVVASGASIAKFVKGARDADWSTSGVTNATFDGSDSQVDYRFDISNPNTTKLTDLVVYDVFPKIGDTGISKLTDDLARGSEWAPTFDSITTLPAGATVEYSTAVNPCRPELYDGTAGDTLPDGCTDDWSTTVPADPTTVTAIRVNVPEIDPGADAGAIQFRMNAPELTGPNDQAITDPGAVANNNVAWHVFRTTSAGSTQSLPAAEAAFVSVRRAAGTIGDRVFLDANRNGLQDAGEKGVPGITVNLLDADGNPVLDADGNPITTVTAADGTYLFAAPLGTWSVSFTDVPAQYGFTTAGAGSDDAKDSDATGAGVPTHTVTLTDPITDGTGSNVNPNLDAGLVLAEVSIVKDDGKTVVKPGDDTTYTITVTNTSDTLQAQNVGITDPLPKELEFLNASDGGSYDPSNRTVTWDIGTLAAGASRSVTVTARIDAGLPSDASIRNVATVTGPCTENCDATDIDNTPPRVTIVKDDHKTVVGVGQHTTYDLTVKNVSSKTDATGVVVTDKLPSQLQYVSASDGGSYDAATRTVIWQLGTLAKGATRTVQVTAEVVTATPAGATITNPASVTTDQGCTDEGDCTTVDVDHTPDITIHKDDHRTTVAADGTTTYDVTVTNNATWAASGVVVSDKLPANASYTASSAKGSYDSSTRTVTWKLGTLPGKTSRKVMVTVKIAATATAGDTVTNTAAVTTDAGCQGTCTSTDIDKLIPPAPPGLAFTGSTGLWIGLSGGILLLTAGLIIMIIRRRNTTTA